jgi:hypothetical protein
MTTPSSMKPSIKRCAPSLRARGLAILGVVLTPVREVDFPRDNGIQDAFQSDPRVTLTTKGDLMVFSINQDDVCSCLWDVSMIISQDKLHDDFKADVNITLTSMIRVVIVSMRRMAGGRSVLDIAIRSVLWDGGRLFDDSSPKSHRIPINNAGAVAGTWAGSDLCGALHSEGELNDRRALAVVIRIGCLLGILEGIDHR